MSVEMKQQAFIAFFVNSFALQSCYAEWTNEVFEIFCAVSEIASEVEVEIGSSTFKCVSLGQAGVVMYQKEEYEEYFHVKSLILVKQMLNDLQY